MTDNPILSALSRTTWRTRLDLARGESRHAEKGAIRHALQMQPDEVSRALVRLKARELATDDGHGRWRLA